MNTSQSNKSKSSRKVLKRSASSSSRLANEKWNLDLKAEFGSLTNLFQFTQEVGRGSYGVVYEALCLDPETKQPTDRKVAVKMFYGNIYPQLVLMELHFLHLVKGAPHIVQFHSSVYDNQFFVVTDFYNNIHFEKIMHPEGTEEAPFGTSLAPMIQIKSYLYAMLEAVASLHSLGVIHRDLKQGNFLYDPETKEGVIIDFGLAEISHEMKVKVAALKEDEDMPKKEIYKKIFELQKKLGENKIGTEGFMPLEQVLKRDKQSYGVDIWSAGVIFLEFLTGKHTLFKNLRLKREKESETAQQQQQTQTSTQTQPQQIEYALGFMCALSLVFGTKKVKQAVGPTGFKILFPDGIQEEQLPWTDIVYHPECDENTLDLLDKMLRLNPDERISAKDALLHPYFDHVRRTSSM